MYRGLYLRAASEMDSGANERVQALAASLLTDPPAWLSDLIPGYVSLYVEYDASEIEERRVWAWLERHAEALEAGAGGSPGSVREGGAVGTEGVVPRLVEIPVVYDGEDLADVAARCGLEPDEVARRHGERTYRVHAMGFLPGFPFLGEVDEKIRVGRKETPRRSVPAHSVAVAGAQTGVYPVSSPGGWRLLGRSLVSVYDPGREQPFLLEPGDTVRFRAVEPSAAEPSGDDAGTQPLPEPEPLQLLPREPRDPVLLVRESGLNDLVVDQGRFLAGRFGLSRGGPLDGRSARLANSLVANPPGSPLLEVSFRGPALEVLAPAVVAFAGAGFEPYLNGERLESHCSFAVRPGDLLGFEAVAGGCRGYLAVGGGMESGTFMGSASTDMRGLLGTRLAAGNVLGRARSSRARPGFSFRPHRSFRPCRGEENERRLGHVVRLRLLPGPQHSREAAHALTAGDFRVESADRTGIRLAGQEVPGGEILSEAVPLGAIQVPPGGNPIVLLNDRGTLGGYEKPAVVHPADLHHAGQLYPGSLVRFVFA